MLAEYRGLHLCCLSPPPTPPGLEKVTEILRCGERGGEWAGMVSCAGWRYSKTQSWLQSPRTPSCRLAMLPSPCQMLGPGRLASCKPRRALCFATYLLCGLEQPLQLFETYFIIWALSP